MRSMPFPKKFTDAEIYRLYEEYRDQDKDLKTFLAEKGFSDKDYFAIRRRFDSLEKRLAKGLPPVTPVLGGRGSSLEGIAEETVTAELASQTAREASDTARWKFILGDKLWRLYADYASRKGWDISKIAEHPIDQVLAEALRKSEEYEKISKKYEEALEALEFFRSRSDPIVRLEIATDMIAKFIETAVLMDALGVDIIESEVGQYYARLIEDYLLGGTQPLKQAEYYGKGG